MIATRSTYDIMLITVTLVLAACFRLATAIPREPRSNDKPIDARTHFTPLPEQQQQQQQHAYYIPEGIHYHANCNVNTLDCTWGQLYNNAWVYVECWDDSPLNVKSSFYKKLIRNDSALQGLEGRQYLNLPISHFRPNAGSYCYIFAAIQENWYINYVKDLKPLEKATILPRFIIKLMKGINYVHQHGVAFHNLDPRSIIVKHGQDGPEPRININLHDDFVLIKTNRRKFMPPIQPAANHIIYAPEWLNQVNVDPRKSDMWFLGELLCLGMFSRMPNEMETYLAHMTITSLVQIVDKRILGVTEDDDRIANYAMERFTVYVRQFYQHDGGRPSRTAAIILHENGGFPENSVLDYFSKTIKALRIPRKMTSLLRATFLFNPAMGDHNAKLLLNTFFKLGILVDMDAVHYAHLDKFTEIVDMIKRIMIDDSDKRHTPSSYLSHYRVN